MENFCAKFLRYVYTIVHLLLLPLIYWRAQRRTRALPEHRQHYFRINERFAINIDIHKNTKNNTIIWIHAVSFGELLVAKPIIENLLTIKNLKLLITTTTISGSNEVLRSFGNNKKIIHCYFPYDLPWIVKRFIKNININLKTVLLIETELWPNLLYQLKYQKINVLLINARLSEKSYRGYQRIACLTHTMLNTLSYVTVQSQPEAERFLKLGLDNNKFKIINNIKFDTALSHAVNISLEQQQQLDYWRDTIKNRPVWIVASTHKGEEEIILDCFKNIKNNIKNLLLILVPRHIERVENINTLCRSEIFQFNTLLRTAINNQKNNNNNNLDNIDVLLVDSMGELLLFYQLADVAFVGGSLVNVGGHNLLEPAAFAIPVLTGPYYFNFQQITEQLTQAGAVAIVNNSATLQTQLINLLNNPQQRKTWGAAGQAVVTSYQGALQENLKIIQKFL